MNKFTMKIIVQAIILFFLAVGTVFGQTTSKKLVLQAFWWDYWNGNYPNSWANYLTELAPRLRTMGVDAVWIPPSYKNTGTNSVGYSPFDHYDLGDKYQKGSTTTRFGTKDEFLRMVAVMHANGIEVIQDIVLNHVDGAGNNDGSGGQDPETSYSIITNSGYKNFRYTCWNTPFPHDGVLTAAEYLAREGRWSKNYTNFHPHLGHNHNSDDWTTPHWGPDFCYGYQETGTGNGYGLSTNAVYNPSQADKYNRDQARQWILWFAKQTGVDGFRWDAVKHFPYFVQQDLSYNVKYLNGWANLGEAMFNVGEYVGGKSDLDTYMNNVKTSNGGSDELMGTFDFGLRSALYGVINSGGGYDLGSIPAQQQDSRVTYYATPNLYVHRTVPFVNNHDTFRPTYDANGNYNGWNTGSELAPHIDPFNARLPVVYAIALALDGSPQLFFEDLFNVSNGKRWTHLPTNTTDLPTRSKIENIIWCHQNLNFKDGAYKVRYQAADRLVIERSMKALIGATDNSNTRQEFEVETDFAEGTVLKDYSGNHGIEQSSVYRRDGKNYFWMKIPKVDGFGGYSIWAPIGTANWYAPTRNTTTTQEWEMVGDMGDRNCISLGQGGPLPANSTIQRLVGKIYAESGKTITYNLYPELAGYNTTIGLYDLSGNLLHETSATGNVTGSYTPTVTGWVVVKMHNTTNTNPAQKAWVKVTYTAPKTVVTSTALPGHLAAVWTGLESTDVTDCRNWETGFEPTATTDLIVPTMNDANDITLTQNTTCLDLKVGANRIITVPVGKTFTIEGNIVNNGTILLESDASGYANLINKGTISGSGNILVKRYTTGYEYHYIAAPNAAATSSSLATSMLYYFDEAYDEVNVDDWVNAWKNASGNLVPAQGYAYGSYSNTTLSFNHSLINTGNISISVTNSNQGENSDGYNLVGNPYPSAIDANAFVTQNSSVIDGTIYLWEDADNDGNFESADYAMWNTLGGVAGAPAGQIPNGYIAPVQGFFVHRSITSPSSANISFTNTMRTSDATLQYYKKDNQHVAGIRLTAVSPKSFSQMLIGFHPDATTLFDSQYDGLKLITPDKAAMYAIQSDDNKCAIMGLPESLLADSQIVIPLGFYTPERNLFTFSLDTAYLTAQQFKVYVFDAETNKYTNLTSEKTYSFYSEKGTSNKRLKLILASTINDFVPNNNKESDPFTLYYSNNKIILNTNLEEETDATLTLYNISGQQLGNEIPIHKSVTEINGLKTDNVLIAHIRWNQNYVVKKVIKQ